MILGYAYSMGANVFQAGDHRRMGYFSTMMLHSASWQVSGRDSEVFKDLKKLSDLYQRMSAELFYRRTGLHSPAWWRRFIYSGKERYLSAQECLKLGLVGEVCEFLDECYIVSSLPRTEDVPEGTISTFGQEYEVAIGSNPPRGPRSWSRSGESSHPAVYLLRQRTESCGRRVGRLLSTTSIPP